MSSRISPKYRDLQLSLTNIYLQTTDCIQPSVWVVCWLDISLSLVQYSEFRSLQTVGDCWYYLCGFKSTRMRPISCRNCVRITSAWLMYSNMARKAIGGMCLSFFCLVGFISTHCFDRLPKNHGLEPREDTQFSTLYRISLIIYRADIKYSSCHNQHSADLVVYQRLTDAISWPLLEWPEGSRIWIELMSFIYQKTFRYELFWITTFRILVIQIVTTFQERECLYAKWYVASAHKYFRRHGSRFNINRLVAGITLAFGFIRTIGTIGKWISRR